MAAGFDPGRFWEITPRLYSLEMAGAMDRMKRETAMVWWGAMMPHLKKPPTFDEFVSGGKQRSRGRDLAACIAAWDRVDRALARGRQKNMGG